MENLLKFVKEKLKIPINFKKISSFQEIDSKIIFNCSGLGSRELNKDFGAVPICGHSIYLNNEKYGEYDYIINFNNMKKLGVENIDGNLYFMPKLSGFLGGTFVMGNDGKEEDLNKKLFSKLIHNARFIFNGIVPKHKIKMDMVTEEFRIEKKEKKI